MSKGPKDNLPAWDGRRPNGLARVRDLETITRYIGGLPARPGSGIRFKEGPNGTTVNADLGEEITVRLPWRVSQDSGGGANVQVEAGSYVVDNLRQSMTQLSGTITGISVTSGDFIWVKIEGDPAGGITGVTVSASSTPPTGTNINSTYKVSGGTQDWIVVKIAEIGSTALPSDEIGVDFDGITGHVKQYRFNQIPLHQGTIIDSGSPVSVYTVTG